MAKGSTMNFKKESAAFAKALHDEHTALGDLLIVLEAASPVGHAPELLAAKEAHEAVRFQRTRTEAAAGHRA